MRLCRSGLDNDGSFRFYLSQMGGKTIAPGGFHKLWLMFQDQNVVIPGRVPKMNMGVCGALKYHA